MCVHEAIIGTMVILKIILNKYYKYFIHRKRERERENKMLTHIHTHRVIINKSYFTHYYYYIQKKRNENNERAKKILFSQKSYLRHSLLLFLLRIFRLYISTTKRKQ